MNSKIKENLANYIKCLLTMSVISQWGWKYRKHNSEWEKCLQIILRMKDMYEPRTYREFLQETQYKNEYLTSNLSTKEIFKKPIWTFKDGDHQGH